MSNAGSAAAARESSKTRRPLIFVAVNLSVLLLLLWLLWLGGVIHLSTIESGPPPLPAMPLPPPAPPLEQTPVAVEVLAPTPAPAGDPAGGDSLRPEFAPAFKPPELAGKTKFLRRLSAGAHFARIAQALATGSGANHRELLETYLSLQPAVLAADWRTHGVERIVRPALATQLLECMQEISANCEVFKECRPEVVKLANTPHDAAGKFGEKYLIRIWNLTGKYLEDEITESAVKLRFVEAVAKSEPHPGYDVLATPRRGAEIFAAQGGPSWAAGVYYSNDRYCTVQTTFPASTRLKVLQHELMHAFCFRHMAEGSPPRVVAEGIAEYLRFVEPEDDGYAVPPARMDNEFAALLAIIQQLEAHGCRFVALQPSRLLLLPARRFYELRHFGYLMGLAAMAFIGPEPIEAAFLSKDYDPILRAIRGIDASEFVEFVTLYAATGDAHEAVIIEDAEYGAAPEDQPAEKLGRPLRALVALGISEGVAAGIEPEHLTSQMKPPALSRSRVRDVLAQIHEDHERVLVLVDRSEAARGAFESAVDQEPLSIGLDFTGPSASSREEFVRSFCEQLDEMNEGSRVTVRACANRFEMLELDRPWATLAYSTESLRSPKDLWLYAKGTDKLNRLVCFVASKDQPAREEIMPRLGSEATEPAIQAELEKLYAAAFQPQRDSIAAVLVVDLSNGDGDALPLARAFASIWDGEGPVAYWNPQAGE